MIFERTVSVRLWCVLALAAIMAPVTAGRTEASQISGSCRLVNVDSVYFRDGGKRGFYLYVGGMRRFANMDVGFEHRSAGKGLLRLEVVGCTKNFLVLPIPTPYVLDLAMNDIPSARSVEIVAANGIVRRRIPGR
ncbi:MAG: hypothetical protein VX871_03360 [Pseudomonadota bacterium]|nr:hypothetical protein [Pseudomonadota bacterium]